MWIFYAVVCTLGCIALVKTDTSCDLLIHVENRTTNLGGCVEAEAALDRQLFCPNITSAFNYISNVSSTINHCVHVNLSSGYHKFTQPHNLSVSLILTGNGATTIQCDYKSSQEPVQDANNLQYTLFFLQVSLVKFKMVQYEKCEQPFRFEAVENVTIIDSYFTQFTNAVIDLYNCIHISIDNSSFTNNTGHGTVFLPLRGNTGAVSIGYHDNSNFGNETFPTVSVTNCKFIGNNAAVKKDTFSTSTTAFLHNRFTGRGGGLAILMGLTAGDLTVNIRGCLFKQNRAVSFGGALYLLFTGKELHHMSKVEDSQFIDNVADNGAGAIQVTFNKAEVVSGQPLTALIRNCNFTGNRAFIGGAVFLFPSTDGAEGNLQILEDCYFYKNHADETGAAVSASQFAFFVPKDKLVNHRITNW